MAEARKQDGEADAKRVTELRVSGHLMTLDTGTFCVFHAPGSANGAANPHGLPGVRISLPPVENGGDVSISTFRTDGWLGGNDAAALIRVGAGPAQVLVTIYQDPAHGPEHAPRLQVLRLSPDKAATAAAPVMNGGARPEVLVHMQVAGDSPGKLGEWAGEQGSGHWIEGFALLPPEPLKPEDIEYQAVLGRDWMSPWVTGGQFCGSRGMALPLLGIRVRLKGDAAKAWRCETEASFIDGDVLGPTDGETALSSGELAPLEAFKISIVANDTRKTGKPTAKAKPATPSKPTPEKPAVTIPVAKAKQAAKPTAKPVVKAQARPAPRRPAR